MKAKILSLLLVAALLVTVGVFAAKNPVSAEYQRPAECDIDYSGALEWIDPDAHTAVCPVCGGDPVVWTALPAAPTGNVSTTSFRLPATGHYYLDENTDYTNNKAQYHNTKDVTGGTYCIYLNGRNAAAASGNPFLYGSESSIWNIIGSGNVQSKKANGTYGAFISYGSKATINLYGGTYSYQESTEHTRPAMHVRTAGAKLNIYKGVRIENCGQTTGDVKGGAILVDKAAEVNMYGGTISECTTQSNGGSVALTASGATFKMHGGTIENGYAKSNGGNLYAEEGGKIEIYGGTVTGGEASSGGNIYVKGTSTTVKSTLTISGGTVSSGKAKTTSGGNVMIGAYAEATVSGEATVSSGSSKTVGGNIQVNGNKAKLTVTGGTITNGNATTNGGNIHVSKGSVDIEDGTVTGGKAQYGGNIYVKSIDNAKSTLTISGGTVSSGEAIKYSGGNVYVGYYGEATVSGDATVSSGSSKTAGGNIQVGDPNAKLTVTGGTIKEGNATTNGGNINLTEGSVSIEGGKITDGTATKSGGNLNINSGYTATMSGGTMSGGKATTENGGNVYVSGTFNLEDTGELTGGVAKGYGGNVGMTSSGAVFNMTGGTLDGTDASDGYGNGGSNLALYDGTANLTGGEIINGNAVDGEHSVALARESATINVGGDVEIDQLMTYGALDDGTEVRVVYADGINIKADFTGTVHLYWFPGVRASVDAEKDIHSTITYGSVLGAPVAVDPTYANTGTITTKGMTAVWDGAKLYIPTFIEVSDAHLKLMADSEIEVTKDTLVDTNGNDLTVTAANDAKVSLIDTKNSSDFNSEPGKVTIDEANLAAKKVTSGGMYYIAVENEDETYSAHCISAKLESVSLRTKSAGIYYNLAINCDDTLEALVETYGVALSLVSMPDNTFMDVGTNRTDVRYTLMAKCECNNGECTEANHFTAFESGSYTSCLLDNILSENATDPTNAQRGQMPVYANGYVVILVDGEEVMLMSDEANQNKAENDPGFDGIAYSIRDILELVDGKLTNENKGHLVKFYKTWAKDISGWHLPNIKSESESQA